MVGNIKFIGRKQTNGKMSERKENVRIAKDCWSVVLSFLSFKECINISLVSKKFYSLVQNQEFSHRIQLYCSNQTQYNLQGVYQVGKQIFHIHEIHDVDNPFKRPHFFHIIKNRDKIQLTIKDQKTMIPFTDFESAKVEILKELCKYYTKNTFRMIDFQNILKDQEMTIYAKLIEISGWINSQNEKERKWIERCLIQYFKNNEKIESHDELFEVVVHPSCENIVSSILLKLDIDGL